MQSLPTVCQEKKEETVWHGMTAGSTVLTQEEAVDIYWAAMSIWHWIVWAESDHNVHFEY